MNWIKEIIQLFGEAFNWLYILQPWEQGVRVRAGKHIKKVNGGLHFKLPYLDKILGEG